jgi:alanine-glyoxylate transaminase/serine-glyoxylate transaminase/serine-pyruvate transaminase
MPKVLLERLRERHTRRAFGRTGELAGKIVRFGTMGDVTESDLLGAIGAIELVLADCGARVELGSGVAAAAKILTDAKAAATIR